LGDERAVGEAHLDPAGECGDGGVGAVDAAVGTDGLVAVEVIGVGDLGRDDATERRAIAADRAVEVAEALQLDGGGRAGDVTSPQPRGLCRPRRSKLEFIRRIHDLRHSFAVSTIVDDYRSGDPGSRLAILSTYLGHADPGDTYWYLSAAPELLGLAGERLERHLRGDA